MEAMSQGVAGVEKENAYQMISNTAFLGKKLVGKETKLHFSSLQGKDEFHHCQC